MNDDNQPCGDFDCRCRCATRHGSCGCDCPRYIDESGRLVLADDE